MKKYLQLSLFSAGVSAAIMLFASTASFAGNYKGENYKGEPMAAPCPVEKSLKDGFYVGGQVGYDSYRVVESYSSSLANGSHAVGAVGWAGGLFAGYGQYFQEAYYLAGELIVNESGASQSNNDNILGANFNRKVSVNNSYGARLLPGIKLNNSSLLYVPLGYLATRVKGTDTAIPVSKSKTVNGFVYGVGMETALCENFSLRGEYTHASNNSFSANGVKWTPYDNQFMLGLVYHFA